MQIFKGKAASSARQLPPNAMASRTVAPSRTQAPSRTRLVVPAVLVGAPVALVSLICGSLSSCDQSARFGLEDFKFTAVQVVSGFPAYIDVNTNTITRVCGAPLRDENGDPLPGEIDKAPNGLELTVNFLSTDPNNHKRKPKCPNERDLSVKEGDRIEAQPLSTSKELQTMKPGQFTMTLDCYDEHASTKATSPCASSQNSGNLPGKVLNYHREAYACDPAKPDTYQNVAVVIDHSGSVQGFVSTDNKKCDLSTKFAEDLPNVVKQTDFNACSSDPYYQLVGGAAQLIDLLDAYDRVVSLGFDETNQIFAGCASKAVCQDDTGAPVSTCNGDCTCLRDSDCTKYGTGLHCGASADLSQDQVKDMALNDGLKWCYGSSESKKLQNKYGIDVKARYSANGRAAVYESLGAAYDFLRGSSPGAPDKDRGGNAKHIVLFTDGPDTCVPSDNFLYTTFEGPSGPAGQCRTECKFTTLHSYKELLMKMAQDKFPIHVHVIQMQSKGHVAPDPTYQELACRSQGTFQFINSEDFARPDPKGGGTTDPAVGQVWQEAMSRAVGKVRYALAGQWRVGFVDNNVTALKKGTMFAARGRMQVKNALFKSLIPIMEGSDSEWRFEALDSNRDTRLPFRVACTTDADCGDGGVECGINSCGPGGICRTTAAPDLSPCGPDGKNKCCKGKCATSCPGVCK